MPNVTKIFITDVSYLSSETTPPEWKEVSAYDPKDQASTPYPLTGLTEGKVIAYNNATGFPVGNKTKAEVNWNGFSLEGEAGRFSIIGEQSGQIHSSVKSPLIRFKVITVVNTVPETETSSAEYSYMMINAAFDADPYDGQPGTASVSDTSAPVRIAFMFPAFSPEDISSDVADAMKQLLSNAANWELENSCAANAYNEGKITPTRVNLPEYVDIAEGYGLGAYKVILEARLNFPATGNYEVKTKFRSSDVSQQFTITGSQSIAATVTQYTGSTKLVLVYGASTAAFTVEVAGASA